ncbi:MAG: class I SAM-dependent methyltransferase [Sideroxyarcus sp.]|nr:class I SAM-dependent methyltransferase [Sideroxyarcus sp.]
MNFKDALYKSYVSTHIAHRKGLVDASKLRCQSSGFRQHFGNHLPTDKSAQIADLGCGSGGLVWWLQHSGFVNSKGVDGSPEQVALAHQLGIDGITLGDVFEFLDKETGYSVLFARDLIEHFDKQSVFDFLNKCFAALSPGGQLVLQIPNAESPYFGRVRYGDFTHELAFSASSISQLLGAVGFTGIEVHPWRPAITGTKSLIRYIAWRLIEPLLKLPIYIESGGGNRIVTMNLIAVARKPG